jgi:hypothetical protein
MRRGEHTNVAGVFMAASPRPPAHLYRENSNGCFSTHLIFLPHRAADRRRRQRAHRSSHRRESQFVSQLVKVLR